MISVEESLKDRISYEYMQLDRYKNTIAQPIVEEQISFLEGLLREVRVCAKKELSRS